MFKKIKIILKKLLPGFIFSFVASYRYGFFGPFKNWEEAKKKSTGYDSDLILNKVKDSLLKVKRGEVAYERDSVLFAKKEYSWPLLSILLFIAGKNNNRLNIVDFGGSLGSTYFQNKDFLIHLPELKWNIVEQPNFVNCGKKYFSSIYLEFYKSIKECLVKNQPSTIVFSSVIEYLEKPYEILQEVLDLDFPFIVFDRTTFLQQGEDMITLQKVPPQVYNASYPCWFLNKEKLIKFLSIKYDLVTEFEALGGDIKQHNVRGQYGGMFFKLKDKYV